LNEGIKKVAGGSCSWQFFFAFFTLIEGTSIMDASVKDRSAFRILIPHLSKSSVMRNVLFFFWLLTLSLCLSAQEQQYLVINPDGHKAIVFDTDLDADGNLVTGSFDKTVKVWDIDRGYIKREFLGQIGPGSEGMVYTIDVSPDDKLLAVSGWMGKDDESEDLGDIRIYNYQTGELKKRLKFHSDAVKTVRFSDEGSWLISADASGFVIRWDCSNWAPTLYERQSLSFSNLDTHHDYFVTAHEDGMIYKWDYMKTKPIKKLNFFAKTKEIAVTPEVMVSASGEYLAFSGKEVGMVLIFNAKWSMTDYFFTGDNEIIDMAFSPSGKRLIIGLKDPGKNRAVVYELQGKKWIELATYKAHDDLVNCVAFIDEETCISSGGKKNEIAVWKIDGSGKTKERLTLSGQGSAIYSASLDENELAYSRIPEKAYGFAPYTEAFDIFSRQAMTTLPDFSKFSFPLKKLGEWSMNEEQQVRENENDPNEILYLNKEDKQMAAIPRYPWDGNRHDAYSFIGTDYLVSGGSYGILEAFDYTGKLKSRFVGHEGDIRTVTTSANGKFMVSSSTDMTIRIWPISEIGKGDGKTANFIYPVASIFIAENKEWVIWNKEGYFTSSKKGAKYVGYHVNQGKSNAAKFYPFDQFDVKYNRPDIILKELGMADSATINLYERAYFKRLKKLGIAEEDLQSDIHAPALNILKYTRSGQLLSMNVKASDSKYALSRLHVFVNDVPVYGRRGLDIKEKDLQHFEQTIEVELMGGENKVQVSVMNNKGVESLRETVYVTGEQAGEQDLYLVSIGVSEYKNPKFSLAYAAKDAEDMVTAFEGNSMYGTVHHKVLVNEQVTREKIIELKEFLKTAKTNDVVMLFVAGHGVLDQNLDYYYATWDLDFQKPSGRGISYAELEELFDGIKAIRKLLIMDTCHSGELDKDDVEQVLADPVETGDVVFRSGASVTEIRERQGLKKTNEVMKEMFNDLNRGTGATVISSAGGAEFAMESAEWKNGLFTYCLLSGLRSGTADLNKDGRIFISELRSYVQMTVTELSKGKQMPAARFENISLDYAIW
jgi:WD40 repeat protein